MSPISFKEFTEGTLCANLKGIRLAKGFSQDKTAALLNVTGRQYRKYESGKSRISAVNLRMLSFAWDCETDDFFRVHYAKDNQPTEDRKCRTI
jgi:transcriptional regulator with XRE-family HTH domain